MQENNNQSICFTIKNYKMQNGLSTYIHADAEYVDDA